MAGERATLGSYARLVDELAPGGRFVRIRRLRGGIGARMHVLDIERADGTRFKVSLRRFTREHRSPEHVAHEYRILQLVEEAKIAAPRPLLLDAEGELFGVPAIALTYLPGAPVYEPRDAQPWADELARTLLSVHAVTPGRFDLSWLSVNLLDGMRTEIAKRRDQARAHSSLAREVHAVLEQELDTIRWPKPVFVHDDFWPGNAVWRFGRVTGVIDWSDAQLGDPRADVSECRIALALDPGVGAADIFLSAYQRRAPRVLSDIWYFDLARGLRALLYYKLWLIVYKDAAITGLTPSLARRRIQAFLRKALQERHRRA